MSPVLILASALALLVAVATSDAHAESDCGHYEVTSSTIDIPPAGIQPAYVPTGETYFEHPTSIDESGSYYLTGNIVIGSFAGPTEPPPSSSYLFTLEFEVGSPLPSDDGGCTTTPGRAPSMAWLAFAFAFAFALSIRRSRRPTASPRG